MAQKEMLMESIKLTLKPGGEEEEIYVSVITELPNWFILARNKKTNDIKIYTGSSVQSCKACLDFINDGEVL